VIHCPPTNQIMGSGQRLTPLKRSTMAFG